MESRLRFLALSMFACVLGCGNALSEPALSDRPKTVKIQFENADAIRLDCDEKDTCDFSIDVFGKKFNLSKSDTGIEDPLIAHTVVLTPISSADLLYYVKVSSFCRKADFSTWGNDPHKRLSCYVLIKARADKVDSLEWIVEQTNVVNWQAPLVRNSDSSVPPG